MQGFRLPTYVNTDTVLFFLSSSYCFFSQYSTEEAHNFTFEGSYDTLFSLFGNITILREQKGRVEQLLDKEENPSDSLVALNVVLDLALNSSCEWVSYDI